MACGGESSSDDTPTPDPKSDRQEVEEMIREFAATGPDEVDFFLAHSTDNFLEDFVGFTREECAAPENVESCVGVPADDVTVDVLDLGEEDARVDLTIIDDEGDLVLNLWLIKEDGSWKIDRAETPDDAVQEPDNGGDESPDPKVEAKLDELVEDADTAVLVVDAFWSLHWSDSFTGSYVSPTVQGGYFGSENPDCGGIYSDGSDNAYYCPADDYIAWDWELMASNFLDEAIGDSFVYLVIAHEWGHAIQERLELSLQSQSAELQADCLAGAAIAGAVDDGNLLLEPGDRGEIFQSLAAIADEAEWGDAEDHGSADERIEAYQFGESDGVDGCLPEG